VSKGKLLTAVIWGWHVSAATRERGKERKWIRKNELEKREEEGGMKEKREDRKNNGWKERGQMCSHKGP
jgi:hypothetical protein